VTLLDWPAREREGEPEPCQEVISAVFIPRQRQRIAGVRPFARSRCRPAPCRGDRYATCRRSRTRFSRTGAPSSLIVLIVLGIVAAGGLQSLFAAQGRGIERPAVAAVPKVRLVVGLATVSAVHEPD
jgi:hypothetical protein